MLDPANPDHYQYLSDFAHHLESIGQPAEARKLREALNRSTHHQRSTTTMPNTKHDLRPRTLGINHAIGRHIASQSRRSGHARIGQRSCPGVV